MQTKTGLREQMAQARAIWLNQSHAELLAALETMLLAVETDRVPGIGLAVDKARAAIAKAKGTA